MAASRRSSPIPRPRESNPVTSGAGRSWGAREVGRRDVPDDRPITLNDVPALLDLVVADRAFLAQRQSLDDDTYFFTRFGTGPQYLRIVGAWQDHAMFQVLNPAAASECPQPGTLAPPQR